MTVFYRALIWMGPKSIRWTATMYADAEAASEQHGHSFIRLDNVGTPDEITDDKCTTDEAKQAGSPF